MRRLLLIVLFAVPAAALLLPAGVGLYLDRWLPKRIAEWRPDADWRLDSGWFRSRLEVNTGDGRAMILHGRHFPYWPPAWLHFRGMLIAPGAEPVAVNGGLGLAGGFSFQATTPRLQWADSARVLTGDNLRLDLDAPGSGSPRHLEMRAGGLVWNHRAGSRVGLENARVHITWRRGAPSDELEFIVHAERAPDHSMELDLTARGIDADALADLADAWQSLRGARPGSRGHNLALLSIAGAWQQLRAAGITVTLDRFILDDAFRISARYDGPADHLDLDGGGPERVLTDWLAAIAGPGFGFNDPMRRRYADDLITALTAQGWLVRESGELRVTTPGK